MPELVQNGPHSSASAVRDPVHRSPAVFWLQGITLTWMLAECGLSLYAAAAAHSPVLLAFGSDSLVELLSATVVLLHLFPRFAISEHNAARAAAILLFALASIVCAIAIFSLATRQQPAPSHLGIAVSLAALVGMPVLAALKRREARRTHDSALAADAVQSATCAWLAAITLAGLGLNAFFQIAWFDSAAALLAVPLLLKEGRQTWQDQACGCH